MAQDANSQLLNMLSPQEGKLLDDQLRRRQLQEGVTNYGSDAMGRFLTAASGAQRASAGFGMLGERLIGGRQKGANELKAERQQEAAQKQQNEADQMDSFKRSVENVMTAQFKGDPVSVLNKRIEVLSRMVSKNPLASKAIQSLEKRREELSITQADLALKGAQTGRTVAQTATEVAELGSIAAKNRLTEAQISKIKNEIQLSGLDVKERELRLDAEAKKIKNEDLNHTGQTSSLASYVNSRSDLPLEERAFYIRQVASKGMKSSDVYDLIKPLTKKEKADMALSVARTNKIKAESGDGSSTTIKPQHRTSFVNTLKDNGVTVNPQKLAEFLTTGDKATLIQNLDIKDMNTQQVFDSINSFVNSLDDGSKQSFYSFRSSLLNNPEITNGQRAIKETKFLEQARQREIERQYNSSNAAFTTITSNMDTLKTRLDAIATGDEFSTTLYVAGDIIGFHYPNSVERSVSNIVKTLKSNAMLETMKELKRLSSTGATGLGATNKPEIEALESKMRALDPLDDNFMEDAAFIIEQVKDLGELAVSPPFEPMPNNGEIKPSNGKMIGDFKVVIKE